LDEPDSLELFEETLKSLKKYNNKIKTVFKPHAATDLDKIEESCKKIGFKNYEINFGHPMVLAYGADFVISYNWSTTMYDAFYLGKPIIEYNGLDPELLSFFGDWSIGGRCCDFFVQRDPEELDEILKKIMQGENKINRDQKMIEEDFPVPSPSFFNILDEMLR